MRPRPALAVAVLVTVALSGCGGSDSKADSSSSTSGSTASSSTATTPTGSSSGPTPSGTVTALPESVLLPIQGMTYERPPGADAAESMQSSADWLSGYLTRVIALNGAAVGTVQVLRLTDTLPAEQSRARVSTFLREYLGGTAAAPQTIAGVQVLVADNVRGTAASVAMFRPSESEVVVITCGGGTKPTLQMVRLWLQAAGKTG